MRWWELFLAAWDRGEHNWRRFAARLTRRPEDAEDLVGEAILRIVEAEPDIDSARGFHRVTLRTIRNLFLNRERRRRRRRAFVERLTREQSAKAELLRWSFADLGDRIDEDRLARAALRHVGELPPDLREAVTLYFLTDAHMSYRDLADALDVSPSTAHKRIEDALALLAQALRDEFNL